MKVNNLEDPAYLRRILSEFKVYRAELIQKKRKREETKQEQKQTSHLKKIQRRRDSVMDQLSKMTPDERRKAAGIAKKKNSIGQLPMHKYTEQYGDETATIKVPFSSWLFLWP